MGRQIPPIIESHRTRAMAPWTYAQLDERQREVARRLGADPAAPGALLLSEVEHVITTGRRTPASDLLSPRYPVLPVDRGGLATYHGPGQWIAFPVDRLERLTGDRRGVRKAVEGLLEAALEVSRAYLEGVEIRQGPETGVWSPRGKIASVGIHVQDGIVLHGLSLNVYPTAESFAGLRPCGLEPRVGYLMNVAAGLPAFDQVGNQLKQAILSRFWQLDLDGDGRYTHRSIPSHVGP